MKILPETPSVDFLRREAKDLLQAMRESEPDATLARAQRALAERYGFGSWTELKAEVERRRASDASENLELGAALASAFGLGTPSGPLTHLSWSQTGERWSLETSSGRYTFRTILDWISPELAEDACRLRTAAVAHGIRTPNAVRSPSGDLIQEVGGKRWCADEWMDVGPAPSLPVSSAVASNAGATLATLHALGLPSERPINPWMTYRRSEEQWRDILRAAKDAGADWAPALEAALPAIIDLVSLCVDSPKDAPMLCICDFGPGAVRVSANDEITIVHWDFAGANTPSWEIGGLLNGWSLTHDGRVNEVAVKALMSGYRERAQAVPQLDLSIFTPVVCAHLNWTAGRIAGALDASDPEVQRREVVELKGLLAHPRSRALFEQMLDVAARDGTG